MLFNSLEFIFFLLFTILFYNIVPKRYRNSYLLILSYYFYGSWNVNYLGLLIVTTVSSYISGILLGKSRNDFNKKSIIFIVCMINFGLLLFFKYYDFVFSPVTRLFELYGIQLSIPEFDFLLPVGISFYTFQAIGYVIDVHRGKCNPEKNLVVYALYVSFFPQLVAGPIERSYQLLPQFYKDFKMDYERLVSGFYLILWGFFQKIVIADRLAIYVNAVHMDISKFSWIQLIVASYFFSIQIYCDFAGYSNIAIGSARLLGFDLMTNFDRPYFSSSIRTFWRRWHISLSSWFRDYLYIPLGGNRVSFLRLYLNTLIVFLLCGLWHGAAWSFVVWGGLHGVMICIETAGSRIGKNSKSRPGVIIHLVKILLTFHLVTFAWIFFRAQNIMDASLYIKRIGSLATDNKGLLEGVTGFNHYEFSLSFCLIMILFFVEFLQSKTTFDGFMLSQKKYVRWSVSYCLLFAILILGVFNLTTFIYFQF